MTKQEMQEHLKTLGLKKTFKPYAEPETGTLMLATRHPAQIVDGLLRGIEICLQGKLFRVWTARKRLANTLAKQHNLRVRLLDREAELWVPVELADALFSRFGAKIKKACSMSQEQLQAHCAKMRLAHKIPL
ncbi:MAG: hypothetical protein WC421_04765 [Elusimicrobiales bacterium]